MEDFKVNYDIPIYSRFWIGLTSFFTKPFLGGKRFEPKSEVDRLMYRCLQARLDGKRFELQNDNPKEGRERLNLLFKLANWFPANDEMRIATSCLDKALYSPQTLNEIINYEANNKGKVKVLYSSSSSNIKQLKLHFNKNVQKIENADLEKLRRIIVTGNSVSREEAQEYNEKGELIDHRAKFYYNIDEEINESLSNDINEWKVKFDKLYINVPV